MMRQLQAELRKLTTTRSTWLFLIGATVASVLGAVMTIGSQEASGLGGRLAELQLYTLAAVNLSVFAVIGGVRLFTEEWRYRSIVPTLLLDPDRRRVLTAKFATAAILGAVTSAIALGATAAVATGLIAARGADTGWNGADAIAAAGLVATCALWAVIGVGMGAIVRHQVGAVVGGLVWILVVENLGSAVLGAASSWLPGQAGYALAQVSGLGEAALSTPAGGGVLVAYAAAIALLGVAFFQHRDVAPV